jgi:hypothetical protein
MAALKTVFASKPIPTWIWFSRIAMAGYRGVLLFVQPPVPPPAPPVPPPAEPVPPPAPEPEPLAPPLVPVPDPSLPLTVPPDGEPGVLSGGLGELLVAPDWVPVASVLSFAAKVAAEAVASRPASKSEVSLRIVMVSLQIGRIT